jgi:hypothetical protein
MPKRLDMSSATSPEAYCRLHRRTFDASQEPACPVCRGVRETPPREIPRGKIAAALTAAVLLGLVVLGGDRAADADAGPSGPRISMNLYRAQVQTIEDMLYARGTQAEPELAALIAETRRLAAMMKETESRLSMTPLILDVSGYADFLVELGRQGFDAGAVENARLEWERVRTRVFEDAATAE